MSGIVKPSGKEILKGRHGSEISEGWVFHTLTKTPFSIPHLIKIDRRI